MVDAEQRGAETSKHGAITPGPGKPRKFLVELIKPSHYDDDGYVIQWWRGWIPSNSLSCLYGLALDARARRVLGDDVDIEIEAHDETNSIIRQRKIIRRFRRHGLSGVVCMVGVQSNQFPRAMDIARNLRRHGIQVVIGGFHVSGTLAMIPELPAELKEALDLGITLFAGEAEGRLDEILKAAYERRLKPMYNFIADLPGLEGQPPPFLPRQLIRHNLGNISSFDAGRGCPFTCSFCTIINVQGRKSRYRSADDVERLIRANHGSGVTTYFISDDNFARNHNWKAILDRIIELREQHRLRIHLTIQVDTACYKIPHFVEKAARAGCKRVFIGLENINPDSLKGASKGQNRITEYRAMLQAWRKAGVLTYAGYILGFPNDTPESIARDIAIIQRELPIDMLEFFMLTPLPGSKDHRDLHLRAARLDPDLNRYDLEHVTTDHPSMTGPDWQAAYDRAWHLYYSREHIETLIKRSIASGINPARLTSMIFTFYASHAFEKVHPLQSGVFRRKLRKQRRSGLPRENPLIFYPRRAREILSGYLPALRFLWKVNRLRHQLTKDPATRHYTDIAITPLENELSEPLELYEATEGARQAAARARVRAAAMHP
jgi:pyruvate-formate lyase-activating enzyme